VAKISIAEKEWVSSIELAVCGATEKDMGMMDRVKE
jgi:hypothetical protein